MMYNLRTAASAVGKSKATISLAIKNGKISAKKNEQGQYGISPAELHRVYPPKPQTVETEQNQTQSWSPPNTTKPNWIDNRDSKIKELELQLKLAESRLDDLRERNDEIKGERDSWRNQATALLPSPTKNEEDHKTLWKRIFG